MFVRALPKPALLKAFNARVKSGALRVGTTRAETDKAPAHSYEFPEPVSRLWRVDDNYFSLNTTFTHLPSLTFNDINVCSR